MIAKHLWHGVSFTNLHLMHSYLTNRSQRIKINNSFTRKSGIGYGVPHGSVLGPLWFYIELIGIFHELEHSNIATYKDVAIPYAFGEDIPTVTSEL